MFNWLLVFHHFRYSHTTPSYIYSVILLDIMDLHYSYFPVGWIWRWSCCFAWPPWVNKIGREKGMKSRERGGIRTKEINARCKRTVAMSISSSWRVIIYELRPCPSQLDVWAQDQVRACWKQLGQPGFRKTWYIFWSQEIIFFSLILKSFAYAGMFSLLTSYFGYEKNGLQ